MEKLRPIWRHYYQNTDIIVYVIDATDLGALLPWTHAHDRALCSTFLDRQIEGSEEIENIIRSYIECNGALTDEIERTLNNIEL